MRSNASALLALSLLACGPDLVDPLTEAGDEHSSSESTSESTGEATSDSTDSFSSGPGEDECCECLNPMVVQTDCTLDLPQSQLGPPNPQQIPYVEIEHDDTMVPWVDDCAREDGWTWLVEGEVVGLCGSWCLQPAGTFAVCYGCPPFAGPWIKCDSQREIPDYCLPVEHRP